MSHALTGLLVIAGGRSGRSLRQGPASTSISFSSQEEQLGCALRKRTKSNASAVNNIGPPSIGLCSHVDPSTITAERAVASSGGGEI